MVGPALRLYFDPARVPPSRHIPTRVDHTPPALDKTPPLVEDSDRSSGLKVPAGYDSGTDGGVPRGGCLKIVATPWGYTTLSIRKSLEPRRVATRSCFVFLFSTLLMNDSDDCPVPLDPECQGDRMIGKHASPPSCFVLLMVKKGRGGEGRERVAFRV